MPQRIQRRRTKGWKLPNGAVIVTRPTVYGNPWRVGAAGFDGVDTAEEAVALFTAALEGGFLQQDSGEVLTVDRVRVDLAGRDLACFCPLDQPCHADVLLRVANEQ